MSNLPVPRYSVWQAVSAALATALRAIEEVRALSRQPGPQGERGERGKDGLGFQDLKVTYDGERTMVLRFARGDEIEEFSFELPTIIDRGVWKDGPFKRGDGVSWGGSFWIAQQDTTTKPETKDSDWRLAVKRGRDGKDGTPGKSGSIGPKGEKGDVGPRGYGG